MLNYLTVCNSFNVKGLDRDKLAVRVMDNLINNNKNNQLYYIFSHNNKFNNDLKYYGNEMNYTTPIIEYTSIIEGISYGISDLILNGECDSILINNNNNKNNKYKLILEICIGLLGGLLIIVVIIEIINCLKVNNLTLNQTPLLSSLNSTTT